MCVFGVENHVLSGCSASIDFGVAGDPVSMEQAFRDGQGDYVHLQGPAAQLLEHDGVGGSRQVIQVTRPEHLGCRIQES